MLTAPVLLGEEKAFESCESLSIGMRMNLPVDSAETAWGVPLMVVAIM
tara:strand:+ start:560 stop:703 length:144 start_codon:yes stop_codon:yes gene_type:complete